MAKIEGQVLFFLATLLSLAVRINCNDYCEIEKVFCHGHQHIACKTTNFPVGQCFNVEIVKMDHILRETILHRHNLYRNDVASGLVGRYPKAAKMQEMEWDEELAYLATEHVKHCNFEHDKCRATAEFPYAGQNLGFHGTTGHLEPLTNITKFIIDEWASEHALVDESVVEKFEKSDLKAGHFTVMVREDNCRIGCAMITYNYKEDSEVWTGVMLTCDYAKTNILHRPVYTVGSPCSGCESIGKTISTRYDALCAP